MSASLKFEMALVIARKIVDSGEFPELQYAASGMLTPVYFHSWHDRIEEWDRDERNGNFWPRIKPRLPEILEWINRNDS